MDFGAFPAVNAQTGSEFHHDPKLETRLPSNAGRLSLSVDKIDTILQSYVITVANSQSRLIGQFP